MQMNLSYKHREDVEYPVILMEPKNRIVKNGCNAVVSCQVSPEKCNIEWIFNGEPIRGERFHICFSFYIISKKMHIFLHLRKLNGTEEYLLPGILMAYSPLAINYLAMIAIDDIVVLLLADEDRNYKLTNNGKFYSLEINSVSAKLAGLYTFRASNSAGSCSSQFSVHCVEDELDLKPRFLNQPTNLRVNPGQKFTLHGFVIGAGILFYTWYARQYVNEDMLMSF